jgi:hypothetical protein
MFIAGPPGADLSCADTMGADRAQATIAEISIEVFMVVFPFGLKKIHVPVTGDYWQPRLAVSTRRRFSQSTDRQPA